MAYGTGIINRHTGYIYIFFFFKYRYPGQFLRGNCFDQAAEIVERAVGNSEGDSNGDHAKEPSCTMTALLDGLVRTTWGR